MATIQSALLSVFYKDGLEPIVRKLVSLGVKLYSTGGTQTFIESLGLPCTAVESVTGYPSILGGRVKTLHPKVFGGILARRDLREDQEHVATYEIPLLDLVMVDLYPFEETVASGADDAAIIEKIDIGGVSLIRAAAKNHKDVCIVASRAQYSDFLRLLEEKNGETSLEDRRRLAGLALAECAHYDAAIANYFAKDAGENSTYFQVSAGPGQVLRYGENPHQQAQFYGALDTLFNKLHGKELSYNNMVDVHAALAITEEFSEPVFAVIKHTNVCGIAVRENVEAAWDAALAADPESAFGGVLATNVPVTVEAAGKIGQIFFEILVAPGFEPGALEILQVKKNRILLEKKGALNKGGKTFRPVLNGVLVQDTDEQSIARWEESGARESSPEERADLEFANIVCKHLKSNAIALVKGRQLIGKGCGQTSRIDSLRQAIAKAGQFEFDLQGAVMASDAFFPFDDCARIAQAEGITAIIQPGGSIRDADTITFCKEHGMAHVLTGMRHFNH